MNKVRKKVREFTKTSRTILLTALLLSLSLEILLRFVFPQIEQSIYTNGIPLSMLDTELGSVPNPNAHAIHWNPEFSPDYEIDYRINNQGFRDHQIYSNPKSQNTLRLLILGDSFAYGVGNNYSKIWTVIFENRLKEQNYTVEVIKAGVPGYDTRRECLYLKRLYNTFKPDIVVINFLFNDLFTNLPIKEGPPKGRKENIKVKDRITLWYRMHDIVSSLHVLALSKRALLYNDSVYSQIYLITRRGTYFDPSSQILKRQLETTKGLFAQVVQFAELNTFQLIIFSIPQQFQIMNRYNTDLEVDYVDRKLKRFAEQHGFHWVSSLDILATVYNNEGKNLYYRIDGHLNNKANKVIGEHFAAETIKIINANDVKIENVRPHTK